MPEYSRSKLTSAIESGMVTVDGQSAKSGLKLRGGEEIVVQDITETAAHDLTPHHLDIEVVYEDEDIMMINKPRGLASHPAATLNEPTLVNVLLARGSELSTLGGDFRPGIVHRLDKETTGIMVVAKNDAAHAHLSQQIESRNASRRYFALVAGQIAQDRFAIDAPIGRNPSNRQKMAVTPKGKHALTHVAVIRRTNAGILIACKLDTGRTHQIRVHLSAVGNPIIGDSVYAPSHVHGAPMQLHAALLAVVHPKTGAIITGFAPAPSDFLASEFATQTALAALD